MGERTRVAIKSNKIRQSARGEECTLQIAGVCNHDPATTVLCHIGFNDGTAKRRRPNERNAVYGCSACHDVIDGRQWADLGAADNGLWKWWYIARALVRTAERRDELGV